MDQMKETCPFLVIECGGKVRLDRAPASAFILSELRPAVPVGRGQMPLRARSRAPGSTCQQG